MKKTGKPCESNTHTHTHTQGSLREQKNKIQKTSESIITKNINDNEVTNNNGITLVALVISIVVLLILSMVSINALVGKNGLITQAQEARTLTLLSEVMFDLESNVLDIKMDNLLNNKTMSNGDMLHALHLKELFKPSGNKRLEFIIDFWS